MKHGAAFESDLQAVTDLHPRAKKEAQTFFETRVPRSPPPGLQHIPNRAVNFTVSARGKGLMLQLSRRIMGQPQLGLEDVLAPQARRGEVGMGCMQGA